MKARYARSIAALTAALCVCSCPARETAIKGGGQGTADGTGESKGPDPRSAFESSGLLGGMTALLETPIALIPASGLPEAGVSLSLGGALSTTAIARRIGRDHELILASGARAVLPGPILALAASGERIVAACADKAGTAGGSLIAFKTEGEGENLVLAWKRECPPARRLLAVPGGRIAAVDETAKLYLIDVSSGHELWRQGLQDSATDIAYAPGLVLAVAGSKLDAYDESTGATVWSAALTAKARSISAGNGVALVLAESGSLSAFSLQDGKGIGAATGPFDPSLRPVADGLRAIAGLLGGGAAEIDVKSGQTLRSWPWEGPASFIAADRDRLIAGLNGRGGRGILIVSRAGEDNRRIAGLESPAFDSPLAVSGARGGLLLLLMDGSLVLIGKNREQIAAASVLEAAIAPSPETGAAIASALGRFKSGDSIEARRYLRFDLFTQGMPVDTDVAFTAFRYEPPASAKRNFAAQPANGGEVVAIFDDAGHEIAASIDELGSSSSATAYLGKGKTYWIVAGWTFQAELGRYRLFIK